MLTFSFPILCLFLATYLGVDGFAPAAASFSASRARDLFLKADKKPEPKQLLGEASNLINDLAKGKLNKKNFEEKISATQEVLSVSLAEQEKRLETGSYVGMGLIGLVMGYLADGPLGGQVDWLIPPLVGAVLLSGGSYYAFTATKDKRAEVFIKSLVGETTVAAGISISDSANAYIAEKKAAALQKKADTVEYISSFPTNTKNSALSYVDGVKLSIQQEVDGTIAKVHRT
jgi:hypothetical protein